MANGFNKVYPRCSIYDQKYVIEGYFVRFGHRSKILKEEHDNVMYTFTEVFVKGSIDIALQKWKAGTETCVFKVNHREEYTGDLTLSQDAKGGRFKIVLAQNQRNKELYNRVENDDLVQTSFEFGILPNGYNWEVDKAFKDEPQKNQLFTRWITEIYRLTDVALVDNPAYFGVDANSSIQCGDGKGMRGAKTKRLTNFHHSTARASLSDRAAEVKELANLDYKQTNELKKLDMENTVNKIFDYFTGIKGHTGIENVINIPNNALRHLNTTTGAALPSHLLAALKLPTEVNLQEQLMQSGLNLLHNGKLQAVNSAAITVSTLQEGDEFIMQNFEDLASADLQKIRLGITYKISNELLASAVFVNSLIQAANDAIFGAILASAINNNIANFTPVTGANFTEDFINNAFIQTNNANGTFISNMAKMIPSINTLHASRNVVNRTTGSQYQTENKNPILYDFEKYLNEPNTAIYGNFDYLYVNLIEGLQVTKNPFGAENIRKGKTDVTIWRQASTAISDISKFAKSTEV